MQTVRWYCVKKIFQMQIIPLSEGSFTIDKTKVFVPFNNHTEQLNSRPIGSLLVEIQPFVIVTEKDVILLDTGLGYLNLNGNSQLHENLTNAGINPCLLYTSPSPRDS